MTTTIASELKVALDLPVKAGETPADFAVRMAHKANDLSDNAWAGLTQAAQVWVNTALDAIEHKSVPPLPDGIEALVAGDPPKTDPKAKPTANGAALPKAAKPEKAAKPPKAEKAPKPDKKKPAADEPAAKRGAHSLFSDDDKIKLATTNPHRAGSIRAIAYDKLKDGMTVSQAVAAGVKRQQIWSMLTREVITLVPPK